MSVAFDAVTDSGDFGGIDFDFTHTPVGTPKAVLLFLAAYNTTTDQFLSGSYGGVALGQLYLASPLPFTFGIEPDGYLYSAFLGSGIPGGSQTVHLDVGSFVAMRAFCITMTASRDTEAENYAVQNNQTTANPSVALTIAQDCFCVGHMMSGQNAVSAIAPGAGMTQVGTEIDFGAEVWSTVYRTTNPTTNTTVDWTVAAADWAAFAIAVREVAFTSSDARTIIVGPSRAAHRAATF